MRKMFPVFLGIAILAGIALYYLAFHPVRTANRNARLREFLQNPRGYANWMVHAKQRCGEAPFLLPTDGYIGYLWEDVFQAGHRHQGIDIFGAAEEGKTPVYAVYAGYLTRLPEWKSSVIIRIPEDPLMPGRQIWTYYTHMANAEGVSFIAPSFPAGSQEVFVPAGTLLGYQGNYSGDPARPVGVHLHFSIVLDDGSHHFKNELEIQNTLDPSPYFGLNLNATLNRDEIPVCAE